FGLGIAVGDGDDRIASAQHVGSGPAQIGEERDVIDLHAITARPAYRWKAQTVGWKRGSVREIDRGGGRVAVGGKVQRARGNEGPVLDAAGGVVDAGDGPVRAVKQERRGIAFLSVVGGGEHQALNNRGATGRGDNNSRGSTREVEVLAR